MDMSKEWAGQVPIWSWFDVYWQSYDPLTMNKGIFSFRSLSFQQLYIFNSNLTYGYFIRITGKVQIWLWFDDS
jgi:hypothetical protein